MLFLILMLKSFLLINQFIVIDIILFLLSYLINLLFIIQLIVMQLFVLNNDSIYSLIQFFHVLVEEYFLPVQILLISVSPQY